MTTPVITIDADARVIDAAEQLSANGITSMPVLDADGRLVGMISELDILRGRLAHDPRSHLRRDQHDMPDPDKTVRSVMTPVAVCLTEFADVADIAETMVNGDMRAIPIVDGPHILGIVSRRDLLRTLVRSNETIAAEIRARLEGQPGVPEDCAVSVNDGIVTIVGRSKRPRNAKWSTRWPELCPACSGSTSRAGIESRGNSKSAQPSLIHTFERG
jgi:CBS domain-containing protein